MPLAPLFVLPSGASDLDRHRQLIEQRDRLKSELARHKPRSAMAKALEVWLAQVTAALLSIETKWAADMPREETDHDDRSKWWDR